MDPVKIGIVLNYKKAEKKKDELLRINLTRQPWLKNTPPTSIVMRDGRKHITADHAIAVYLETHFPDALVDYIEPHEISTSRFKQNDIVFIIIYDLLESFHLSDHTIFNKFKSALKNSGNVYPPYEYQKFINNKCTYYKYLANKGIPTAPTHCVTRKKWYIRNPDKYINTLISKVKENKWDSIVTKPIYGQESKDFKKYMSCDGSLECQKKNLKKYFQKNIGKYKGFVVQEYIKGFDKSNPEMRMFFVDGNYLYTMGTSNRRAGVRPEQEGGPFKVNQDRWDYLMKFSQHVMDSLPKLDLPGDLRSPILTRIDIGAGLEGTPHTLFVNEVEFVPSLYVEDQKHPVLEKISESLYSVSKIYQQRKAAGQLPVKVLFN
jgi:hypothetical protein